MQGWHCQPESTKRKARNRTEAARSGICIWCAKQAVDSDQGSHKYVNTKSDNGYGNKAEIEAIEMYQSRAAPMRKGDIPKSKLTMSTTKAALMSKEIADMKIKKRQEDPFEKNRTMFKMDKFKKVGGKVTTNRDAFSHHKKQRAQSQNPQDGGKAGQEGNQHQQGYDEPVQASN